MTISLYQSSVPVFIRALQNLRHVLAKGEAHALEKSIAPEVLLNTRLVPDMLPLVRQVQIATDLAKNGAARLAGVEPLKFEDDETTFAQLYERIDRALAYIGDFKPGQIDGQEQREVTLVTRANGEMKFAGQSFLLDFVLPNVFFHASIAYAILRDSGVTLGKADYLGGRQ